MPRPLRTQEAETFYHVYARGTGGAELVRDRADNERFIRILEYTVYKHRWRCHAYCLMTTHYHLLVWTPGNDLARGMQLLNGLYAQTFNQRHGRFGHLVAERYSSKPVDTEEYALELCRYIVLNPVRAGICARAEQWPWSSYAATIGLVKTPAFLAWEWVLDQFGGDLDTARAAYGLWVEEGTGARGLVPGSDPVEVG